MYALLGCAHVCAHASVALLRALRRAMTCCTLYVWLCPLPRATAAHAHWHRLADAVGISRLQTVGRPHAEATHKSTAPQPSASHPWESALRSFMGELAGYKIGNQAGLCGTLHGLSLIHI